MEILIADWLELPIGIISLTSETLCSLTALDFELERAALNHPWLCLLLPE